jgi:hypothetical protein
MRNSVKIKLLSILLAVVMLVSFSQTPIQANAYSSKYMSKTSKKNINNYVKRMKIIAQNNKNYKNKTYTVKKIKAKNVVLIFGRTGCSNTMNMIREAERLRKSGKSIKVVFLAIDSYDSGLYYLRRQYPKVITSMNYPYNRSHMWTLLRYAGWYDCITLPATFIFNKKNKIRYWSYSQNLYGLRTTLK